MWAFNHCVPWIKKFRVKSRRWLPVDDYSEWNQVATFGFVFCPTLKTSIEHNSEEFVPLDMTNDNSLNVFGNIVDMSFTKSFRRKYGDYIPSLNQYHEWCTINMIVKIVSNVTQKALQDFLKEDVKNLWN